MSSSEGSNRNFDAALPCPEFGKAEILKVFFYWAMLAVGLATVVFPIFWGRPLFPRFVISDLRSIPVWALPFEYTFSYLTKAWGPLAFAFCVGGAIVGFVPKEKFQKMLASGNARSYVIAATAAPFLTVCSCAMIPIFGGLLIGGAGLGPAVTFLLMAPAANVMAVMFTGSMISWKIALSRVVFSYFGAMAVGFLVSKTAWGKAVEQRFAERKIVFHVSSEDQKPSLMERSLVSLEETRSFAVKILPYLLGGVAVISFVEAYLPPQVVSQYMTGVKGVVLGAVIGVPTYTPSLVEVFLVKAMLNLGMAPSAALAFLIGGPICSIPSMMAASRIAGWKVVLSYAFLTIFVAILAGFYYLRFVVTL